MQSRNRVYRLSVAVIFIGLLLGAIAFFTNSGEDNDVRTETEGHNEPTALENDPTTTPPPPVNQDIENTPTDDQPSDISSTIEAYLRSQGDPINNDTLDVWQTVSIGDTQTLIGFSYTDSNNFPCIGLVIGNQGDGDIINIDAGHSTCATSVDSSAIAGSWSLVTNDNPPMSLTATVGEVFNPSALVMSGGIVYSDGTNAIVEHVENNRFLETRTDSPSSVTRVIFINEFGYIEAEVIPNP